MEIAQQFIEQHSSYVAFMVAAICSFFFSLPKDLNPLSAIALIFQQIDKKVNLESRSDSYKRMASCFAFTLILAPIVLIMSQLYVVAFKPLIIDLMVLFILLSWHDKMHIYQQVNHHLKSNNLPRAKMLLSLLTLRDTRPLSLTGIKKATIESMVLQTANGWFCVIFWYLATGIYGALFYQLLYISAQQWNHKLPKYQALGYLPALITKLLQLPAHIILSFTFSLYDRPIKNLVKKFKQSVQWHHFSSGLLLSSFALSLQTQLGGVRIYDGAKVTYSQLGLEKASNDLEAVTVAKQRISLSAWFWLICISGYEFTPDLLAFLSSGYNNI